MTASHDERLAQQPTEQPAETGDVVIDAALRDLADAEPTDLDAQIEAGERVHQTLQSRLTDLGGD